MWQKVHPITSKLFFETFKRSLCDLSMMNIWNKHSGHRKHSIDCVRLPSKSCDKRIPLWWQYYKQIWRIESAGKTCSCVPNRFRTKQYFDKQEDYFVHWNTFVSLFGRSAPDVPLKHKHDKTPPSGTRSQWSPSQAALSAAKLQSAKVDGLSEMWGKTMRGRRGTVECQTWEAQVNATGFQEETGRQGTRGSRDGYKDDKSKMDDTSAAEWKWDDKKVGLISEAWHRKVFFQLKTKVLHH